MDPLKELAFGNKQRFCAVLVAVLLAWTSFAAACLVSGLFDLLKGGSAVLAILLLLLVSGAIRYRDSKR
jgi:hypothetical protein